MIMREIQIPTVWVKVLHEFYSNDIVNSVHLGSAALYKEIFSDTED